MKTRSSLQLLGLTVIALIISTNNAAAGDYPKSSKQERLERSGTYMSGKGTAVENSKNIPCNGVKDCRSKGQDLDTVSQFEGSDYSASQYPGPCRRASAKGYVFHPSEC